MAWERIQNFALEERIFKQLAADSAEARIPGLATPTLIVWGNKTARSMSQALTSCTN